MSTRAGRALGLDPLSDLSRLVAAIDELGLVTARTAGRRFIWATLAPFFDDLFVPLSVLLLSTPGPSRSTRSWSGPSSSSKKRSNSTTRTGTTPADTTSSKARSAFAIGTLEAAGIGAWQSEVQTSQHGTTKRARGTVTLTYAGRWTLHRHLSEVRNVTLPVARPAEFTDHDFETLITACETTAPDDVDRVMREIAAWIDQRGDEAMPELTLAARTTTDPTVRNIALAVVGERFAAAAEPYVRTLLDTPSARGAALLWLVEHEHEPADVLVDPDPAVFADVLALTLVSRGPADMTAVFEHVGDHDTQLNLLQQLWRQPTPAVGPVLGALGRHHPTAGVSKSHAQGRVATRQPPSESTPMKPSFNADRHRNRRSSCRTGGAQRAYPS